MVKKEERRCENAPPSLVHVDASESALENDVGV